MTQGGLASTFVLALLLGSGCTGDAGEVNFEPIAGSSGLGASAGDSSAGGSKPNGAGAGSGAAQNQGGKSTGGSGNKGGSASGGAGNGGGTDAGGEGGSTDTGGGGNGGSAGGPTDACSRATFDGHTYAFCGTVSSGAAAFELCEERGMALVSIESQAENDFLIGKLAGSTWLGGSDEGHEGVWHWPTEVDFWDDTGDSEGPIEGQYHNWKEGQPNNANDDGLDENCAVLEMSEEAKGTWNDVACGIETEFRATCESTGPGIDPIPL